CCSPPVRASRELEELGQGHRRLSPHPAAEVRSTPGTPLRPMEGIRRRKKRCWRGRGCAPKVPLGSSLGRCRLGRTRSEEHTSELQSRFDLVCRLLLEKKKRATRQFDTSGTGEII